MIPQKIIHNLYLVGSAELTDPKDCSVYLLDFGELVLIDSGAGKSVDAILSNITRLGLDPARLSTIILTHCHIDHVGGANEFKERFKTRLVMHPLDAAIVERGDQAMTGAAWYGIRLQPMVIDIKCEQPDEHMVFGAHEMVCLHTPGHSPGSLSVYTDIGGKRVLFGQDIHGPFIKEFGASLRDWTKSMQKLLALKADILCEGHFGVIQPNSAVTEYIERYLEEYGE